VAGDVVERAMTQLNENALLIDDRSTASVGRIALETKGVSTTADRQCVCAQRTAMKGQIKDALTDSAILIVICRVFVFF
jgi:hypothetical protein